MESPSPLTEELKRQIYDEAKVVFVERFGHIVGDRKFGFCAYWTVAAAVALKRHGIAPLIAAGSLSWPILNLKDDDGVSNTHFSYMWSPDERPSLISVAQGYLPEMHVWLFIKEPEFMLVDFSVGSIKEHAESLNIKWRTKPPPLFLFTVMSEIHFGVIYSPNRTATLMMLSIFRSNPMFSY